MRLENVVRKECVAAQVPLKNKGEVLREIARLASQCPVLQNLSAGEIEKGLVEREALGSTGFGGGIAIPHCRLDGVDEFVVGLISLAKGVNFDAVDGKPVRLVAFIIGPTQESGDHIRLLSALSQVLSDAKNVKKLAAFDTADELAGGLVQHEDAKPMLEPKEHEEKVLIHLFVSDEGLFHEILPLLAGEDECSLVIMEAENSGKYLAKMPLFAGLWTDAREEFCRVLVAVADKRLRNEILRRVQSVTGELDARDDVMILIQDLAYAAGAIGA